MSFIIHILISYFLGFQFFWIKISEFFKELVSFLRNQEKETFIIFWLRVSVVESWHRSYCNGWELDKYSQASLLLTVKPFIASHLNSFILTPILAIQRKTQTDINAQTQTTRHLQSNIKFIPWFVLWMKQSWGNDSHKKIWQFQMFHLENVSKIETSTRH